MKTSKKILSLILTVALVSSINWGYFTQLLNLTKSAAIELVTGGSVAGAALVAELNDLSISKFFEFKIDDFLVNLFDEIIHDDSEDNTTTEDVAFEDTTEESDDDSVTDDEIKSGKDLIKNISKIEYGSDELSNVAIEYRKANSITSARRNVCVVEYKNIDGTILKQAFASNVSNHSEELMIEFLKENNISGEDVLKIFTEREPCVETATNAGHNCTNLIIEYMSDAEVTYAVDYGVTQEDGLNARNTLQEILQKLLE